MPKAKETSPSEETKADALRIAKGTQRQGQTKEQTKLIAQGIQKGIDIYKKEQKVKKRDLNRQKKKLHERQQNLSAPEVQEVLVIKHHWLPWVLLAASLIGFGLVWLL